jgi:hypothetical protein
MSHKVLVIGPLSEGDLAESYAQAFERLGMEVVRFDSDAAMAEASRFSGNRILRRVLEPALWNAANRQAIAIAERAKPELIFAVKCAFFHAETVRQIRKSTGAPFVDHYPDHPYLGVRWVPKEASAPRRDLIEVLRQYSIVWMWERSLMERLRADGVEARFLSFAVDPEVYRPQVGSNTNGEGLHCDTCGATHEVVFVAHYSRYRCAEVAAIRRHKVAIWGRNWPREWQSLSGQHRVHQPVRGRDVSGIYAGAQVSLNVLNAENLGGPNMRTFEIPASGGVMLARYSPEQCEFFPEGEAALYYRSPGEIDDKIDLLLRDHELRDRLRRNAVRLAAAQTYDVRAATVLRECGLATPALARPGRSTV